MNKRLVTLGLLILAVSLIGKLLFMAAKNIKVDDFHKAFIDFRNKNANIINSAPTFSVGKENNNDSFTYNFGCYCAGSRSNY